MFLYEGHIGTLYFSDTQIDERYLHCSQCGDFDWELGEVETWQDVIEAIGIFEIQVDPRDGGWARDYVYELVSELPDHPSEEEFYAYLKKTQIKEAFENVERLRYEDEAAYELDYYNEVLIREFPFIKENDEGYFVEWAKERLNIYTWIDEIPTGWRKAFGLDFLYELKDSLINDGTLEEFGFLQIKEKYGTLRLYCHGYGEHTKNTLCKYEELSRFFCVHCGKRAKYVSQGWISPWCEECSKEIHDTLKPIEEVYEVDIDKEINKIRTDFKYEDYWKSPKKE